MKRESKPEKPKSRDQYRKPKIDIYQVKIRQKFVGIHFFHKSHQNRPKKSNFRQKTSLFVPKMGKNVDFETEKG